VARDGQPERWSARSGELQTFRRAGEAKLHKEGKFPVTGESSDLRHKLMMIIRNDLNNQPSQP